MSIIATDENSIVPTTYINYFTIHTILQFIAAYFNITRDQCPHYIIYRIKYYFKNNLFTYNILKLTFKTIY